MPATQNAYRLAGLQLPKYSYQPGTADNLNVCRNSQFWTILCVFVVDQWGQIQKHISGEQCGI